MRDYIEERAVEIAYYIIEHGATVRQAASQFGVSKSTVHKDVTERLLQVRPMMAANRTSPSHQSFARSQCQKSIGCK